MPILANVAIPTVAIHIIAMFFLFIPIVIVEAIVLAKRHKLESEESFNLMFIANLKSTLIGLPLGYFFAVLGLIPPGIFASFLPEKFESAVSFLLSGAMVQGGTIPMPMDPELFNEAGFYIGTLLVMIPYYLVTLHIERKAIIKRKPDLDTPALKTTLRIANDITYGAIVLFISIKAFIVVIDLAQFPR